MRFVLPDWYVLAICWAVSFIVLAVLICAAVGAADAAISRLWRFLKLEGVVIDAIWKDVKRKRLAKEAADGES
jgi:hypothetical protein